MIRPKFLIPLINYLLMSSISVITLTSSDFLPHYLEIDDEKGQQFSDLYLRRLEELTAMLDSSLLTLVTILFFVAVVGC